MGSVGTAGWDLEKSLEKAAYPAKTSNATMEERSSDFIREGLLFS